MSKKTAAAPSPAEAGVPGAAPAATAAPKKTAEEKAADKAAAKAAKDAAKGPEQNGVRRPKTGTVIGRVWDILDAASAQKRAPATLADVKDAAADINGATLRTQYARWRKFNGVAGRVAATAAPAATEGQAAA